MRRKKTVLKEKMRRDEIRFEMRIDKKRVKEGRVRQKICIVAD